MWYNSGTSSFQYAQWDNFEKEVWKHCIFRRRIEVIDSNLLKKSCLRKLLKVVPLGMHKNKIFLIVFFLLIFSASAFLFVSGAEAQLKYTLLEKIPGFASTDGSNLPAYIQAIYKTALIVIVLSALFMLSVGGFMYLTSAGNTSAMSTAKGVIFDSIIGLVIALTAWLLLNTINPDLVNVTLNGLSAVPVVTPGGVPIVPGVPPTGTVVSLATQIKGIGVLQGSGECSGPSGAVSPQSNIQNIIDGKAMSVCSPGCKTKGSSGCTDNVVQPSETMLKAIITVKSSQSFTITSIAGGAHGKPTSDHYIGRGLDISPATQVLLDTFIANGAVADLGGRKGSFCEAPSGAEVVCASGQADHIHVKFSN
ncbi:MAG: hypothetical protein Q8Q10_04985 [bacterium]|nr:hypothetical protein [bacterium]